MRIGVYICHCGLNIAHTINVSSLQEKVNDLEDVTVKGHTVHVFRLGTGIHYQGHRG